MKAAAFKESAQDVLFVLKIDMGSGRHSFIDFGQTDTPEDVALHFCKSHGLSIKTYDFLVDTLQQKRLQVLGAPPQPPKTMSGDFGFGAPVETVEYQLADQRYQQQQASERQTHKSSGRVVSGKKPPFTSATSASERNLTAKWRSPLISAEQRPTETNTKQLEDKIGDHREVEPKGMLLLADVYERLYFNAKTKQLVDPLTESRSAASALPRPRPKSSDSRSQSVSGTQAPNRLYYCGLKNKSIRE